MDTCCSDKSSALEHFRGRQSVVLRRVLYVNASMFVVELTAGLLIGSLALLADSLDMLGDALVYGVSLYVVAREPRLKARAAMLKAAVMAGFGLFVLTQLVLKIVHPQTPTFEPMGIVGLMALVANALCFALLWRHRIDDINMRSVWMCSRNDLVANSLVIVAAIAVGITGSPWPDVAVGAVICALFLRSALVVTQEAMSALRTSTAIIEKASAR